MSINSYMTKSCVTSLCRELKATTHHMKKSARDKIIEASFFLNGILTV